MASTSCDSLSRCSMKTQVLVCLLGKGGEGGTDKGGGGERGRGREGRGGKEEGGRGEGGEDGE